MPWVGRKHLCVQGEIISFRLCFYVHAVMSSTFKYLERDSETHPSLFTVEPAASREIYDESKGTLVFSNFKFFLRKMTASEEMMIQLV